MGKHPLVCQFMAGAQNLRPSIPKYSEIWDVDDVLRCIKDLPQPLTTKQLSCKTAMLQALDLVSKFAWVIPSLPTGPIFPFLLLSPALVAHDIRLGCGCWVGFYLIFITQASLLFAGFLGFSLLAFCIFCRPIRAPYFPSLLVVTYIQFCVSFLDSQAFLSPRN